MWQRYTFPTKCPKFLMGKNNLFFGDCFFPAKKWKDCSFLFTFCYCCCYEKNRGAALNFFSMSPSGIAEKKHWAINLNWKRSSKAGEGARFKITLNFFFILKKSIFFGDLKSLIISRFNFEVSVLFMNYFWHVETFI